MNVKTEISIKEKFKDIFCVILTLCAIAIIPIYLRNKRLKEIDFISKDYILTKGIITDKTSYKGKSITVKYKVDNIFYEDSDGYDIEDNIEVGDSILIKYSKTKPEFMITIFNDKF